MIKPCVTKTVLIAEDDPDQSSMLSELLQMDGFKTKVVSRGDEALEALREDCFELAIMDVRMPGMGGEQVLHELRNTLRKTLPVIMVSSFASPADLYRLKQEGADACLSKPFSYERLAEKIDLVLNSRSAN